MAKYTYADFQAEFPNEDACLDRVMVLRYGPEPVCPKCERKTKFHRVTGRRQYACQHCGHHVAPCVGTPFEKSSTPLTKWFHAMCLFTATRHGVPAKELERQLGVTYKCAWRIGHELRKLMASADGKDALSGHVEMDETLVGGYRRQGKERGGDPARDKTRVMGMVERGGSVRTAVIDSATIRTIDYHVDQNILWGSTLSTDEWMPYKHLGAVMNHGVVRHRRKEWRNGIHHTNTIEGYWSHLKNSIKGTHMHVSPKHLQKYTNEFSFRYILRKDPAAMFSAMLSGLLRQH